MLIHGPSLFFIMKYKSHSDISEHQIHVLCIISNTEESTPKINTYQRNKVTPKKPQRKRKRRDEIIPPKILTLLWQD